VKSSGNFVLITPRLCPLLLLACLQLWATQFAYAQISTTVLQPDSDRNLHLEPGAQQSLTLRIPAGQALSVSFEQTEGSVQVRWLPEGLAPGAQDAGEPRVNRSGRHSLIVFRTVGVTALSESESHSNVEPDGQDNHKDAAGSFVVQNQSKRIAEVRIIAGALRPTTTTDLLIAQAEHGLAEALALSANRTPENAKKSLELLKSAEQRWRALGDRDELARTLSLEAYTEAFPLNDGATALTGLSELIDLASQIAPADTVEAANARKTAAFVYAKQAMYDQAREQYNEALRLFERTEDLYNRVVVLENRAKVERMQGQNALALADVQAAIPLAQQNSDGRGELALEVERGAIAYSSGQLGIAYEADLRAVSLAQGTRDDYLEALAWSDMGVVCTELHEFDEANRALDHADAIWKRTPNAYGEIQTSEDRAELRLARGDIAGARTAFSLGAEQAAKNSLDRERIYFLHGLAVSEMRSGKIADADRHLGSAIHEAERVQLTDTLSSVYASSGDLLAVRNHWTEAAAEWQRADSVAAKRGDALDHVIALGDLVRAAVQLGDLDSASDRCQQAMSALESIRAEINDADLRLSFFSSRHALYDLCVQTELRRAGPKAAFDAAERGRARSLMDVAAASGIQVEFPNGLLERIHENEKMLTQTRKQLSESARTPAKSDVAEDASTLLQERERLRTEAAQSGLSGALSAASVPLTEQEVRQHLDAHTALLAYWLGRNSSCVWLITDSGISVYPLASEKMLKGEIRRYLTSLLAPLVLDTNGSAAERVRAITAAQSSALEQGQTLRRTLMPMRIPSRIHRLLIVKDGAIISLSFASLPNDSGGYLGEKFELASEPSAAFAFRPSIRSPAFSQIQAVVFTDPSNSASGQAHSDPGHARQQPQFSSISWTAPLPFARQEARFISQTFGERNTKVFAGASASRENAIALNWNAYEVAHFATHAVFRETHTELSGLVLASEDVSSKNSGGRAEASILSFSDVLQMKAPLQLAMLSVCSSGVGKFVPGEGMLALDNAFLAAGASRVIGTLWPVEDEASSIFMGNFYRALARSHSPILSLQEAQQEMAASRQWSAPYYWGAFFLSGNWHPFSD
jgi:CHAT domain-containing protein